MSKVRMSTVKEQARRVVENLSDNATWDDLMYRIHVRQKIAEGIRAGEEGRVQSHEEVERMFASPATGSSIALSHSAS